MRFGSRLVIVAGLVAAVALVANGCGQCPVCNFFASLFGSSSAPAPADQSAGGVHAQTNCPICGGRINQAHYVDYEGKRIYCCAMSMCLTTVRKDPAKYVQQLEAKGITLARVPATP